MRQTALQWILGFGGSSQAALSSCPLADESLSLSPKPESQVVLRQDKHIKHVDDQTCESARPPQRIAQLSRLRIKGSNLGLPRAFENLCFVRKSDVVSSEHALENRRSSL